MGWRVAGAPTSTITPLKLRCTCLDEARWTASVYGWRDLVRRAGFNHHELRQASALWVTAASCSTLSRRRRQRHHRLRCRSRPQRISRWPHRECACRSPRARGCVPWRPCPVQAAQLNATFPCGSQAGARAPANHASLLLGQRCVDVQHLLGRAGREDYAAWPPRRIGHRAGAAAPPPAPPWAVAGEVEIWNVQLDRLRGACSAGSFNRSPLTCLLLRRSAACCASRAARSRTPTTTTGALSSARSVLRRARCGEAALLRHQPEHAAGSASSG